MHCKHIFVFFSSNLRRKQHKRTRNTHTKNAQWEKPTHIQCRPRITGATCFLHSINNLFVFSLPGLRCCFFRSSSCRSWQWNNNKSQRQTKWLNGWHRSSFMLSPYKTWVNFNLNERDGEKRVRNCLLCWFACQSDRLELSTVARISFYWGAFFLHNYRVKVKFWTWLLCYW